LVADQTISEPKGGANEMWAILLTEPRVEVFARVEHIRQQEVEQRPELVQIVLKRRACQHSLETAASGTREKETKSAN
jgi:hypothetical protein